MEYHDKVLKCAECSAEFVFTAGEQMFFADKGFKNEPKRCKACKAKRAEGGSSGGGGGNSTMRAETRTNCSQCGKETTVPFRPTQGRPVLCREGFQQKRHVASALSIQKNSSNMARRTLSRLATGIVCSGGSDALARLPGIFMPDEQGLELA